MALRKQLLCYFDVQVDGFEEFLFGEILEWLAAR